MSSSLQSILRVQAALRHGVVQCQKKQAMADLKLEEATVSKVESGGSGQLSETGEEWQSDNKARESEVEEEVSEAEEDEIEEWDDPDEEADVEVDEDDVAVLGDREQDADVPEERQQGNIAAVLVATTPPTVRLLTTRPVAAGSEAILSNLPLAVPSSLRSRSFPVAAASLPRDQSAERPAMDFAPYGSVAEDAGQEDDCDDYYDSQAGEDESGHDSSEYDMADESDVSDVAAHQRQYWDRPAPCNADAYGSEYAHARSSEAGTAALYALCESVDELSHQVSDVTPALYQLNVKLNRVSRQQLQQHGYGARSSTGTSRCAELGWPAASLSLLTVLLMLIMPLWLPWAWERHD